MTLRVYFGYFGKNSQLQWKRTDEQKSESKSNVMIRNVNHLKSSLGENNDKNVIICIISLENV